MQEIKYNYISINIVNSGLTQVHFISLYYLANAEAKDTDSPKDWFKIVCGPYVVWLT